MDYDWQRAYDDSTGNEGQDHFFEVVPPTPFDLANGSFQQNDHNPQAQELATYLQPTVFRNHRSCSSGSISSQISGVSGMTTNLTQWGSDTDQYSDLPNSTFDGISVDPKLFQAKVKTPSPELHVELEPSPAPVKGTGKVKRRARTSRKDKDEESDEKKKISHARKAQQHPEHIPRPRNAFILFRKHVVDSKLIPTSVEIRHQNVSIITAKMWSEASAEQKAHFAELARIEKEEHLKKYPGYRYQPVYRRTNVVRRRVRKDAAEEEKCKSVAQLLMQGKTGEELAEEIKENGKSAAKGRAPSKKGHANELSKGALRALRAQARQGGSGEGSDMSLSRSVSRVVSPEPTFDEEESADEVDSPEPLPFYLPEPLEQPVLVPDQGYEQPTMSWGYQQPNPHMSTAQLAYQHAQHPEHVPMQQYHMPVPSGGYHTNMAYSQHTQQMMYEMPAPDFYAHDQALPSSPSISGFGHVHSQPGQPIYRGMREGVDDMVFSTLPDGPQSPIALYRQSLGYGNGLAGSSVPASARWDRGFEGGDAVGNADGSFEGLGDLLLNEYGSALAQVDETSVW